MWLSALLPWVSRVCAFVYYRVEYAGTAVPPSGPLLLVANHQNSLLDPMLVAAAARRPVRFLAKAPLFTDQRIGWLIKAAGAIPVYRRIDDASQMGRNEDTFRAAFVELAGGSAVGLFPEGTSHSEPKLEPLRTGAARIALGAAATASGGAFPIVPIGLVFRDKDVFRSRALALSGEPVGWDDLARRGPDDGEAVRALTGRIEEALRSVTINVERWEDQPLIECALEIWEVAHDAAPDPAERIAWLEVTTRILAEVRRDGDPGAVALARDVDAHRRRLRRLRLRPADLGADVSWSRGRSWAARRVLLVLPTATLAALAGFLLFWVPFHLTGWIVDRVRLDEDERSTWKLLVGIAIYALWVIGLSVSAGVSIGPWIGLLVFLGVPVIGMAGLRVRERWRGAWDDARRFFLLRTRHPMLETLRARQRDLAARLDALVQARATAASNG